MSTAALIIVSLCSLAAEGGPPGQNGKRWSQFIRDADKSVEGAWPRIDLNAGHRKQRQLTRPQNEHSSLHQKMRKCIKAAVVIKTSKEAAVTETSNEGLAIRRELNSCLGVDTLH